MKNKQIIYIAHAIGGDVKNNLSKINDIYHRLLKSESFIPFAPYVQLFQHLDDDIPCQRELGMSINKEFFKRKAFDEMVIYGHVVSKGVEKEIEWCKEFGIPYRFHLNSTYMAYSNRNLITNSSFTHEETLSILNALEFTGGKKLDYLDANKKLMNKDTVKTITKNANKYLHLAEKIRKDVI